MTLYRLYLIATTNVHFTFKRNGSNGGIHPGEKKPLVQVPGANATGTAPMEIDDNDNDDFSILHGAPLSLVAPAA